MSDAETSENDAQDDTQDDGSDDTTDTLSREDIPETAHITACGDVISNDGEHLGEVDPNRSVPSTSDPWGSSGESTRSTTGDSE